MLSIRQTTAALMLQTFVTAADADGAAAVVIYSGNIPASSDASLAGNVALATIACLSPCGTVSGRTLTFATVSETTTVAHSGTATFFRVLTANNEVAAQGTISSVAGRGDLKLSQLALQEGAVITINDLSIQIP